MNYTKSQKLIIGIILDLIGYGSYLIPGFLEFADIIWAPLSSYFMTKLYQGREGKIAAAINFVEEALPGLDFIPTFTLMWLYTYVYKKKDTNEIIIDID